VKLKPQINQLIANRQALIGKIQKGSWVVKMGIIFITIFLILLILAIILGPKRKPVTVLPATTPPPIGGPTEEITHPSAYATDTAILKIEGKLKDLEQKLQSEDLREIGLNPPLLDFEVKF
jgi:hypothetical protein